MVALKVVAGILAATSATFLYFLIIEFNPFLHRCNPAICHSYALSALRVHSAMQHDEHYCDFGVLPGFLSFNVMKLPGTRWQTAVEGCQLNNLLQPTSAVGDTRVLVRT
jgi:hypothetical protein